jgi:p-hydroxybenzoate 3-monooxygenase
MKTQVAIIGAGPAGMLLAHSLHQAGIDCIVLEQRDQSYVEGRVRAGILEPIAIELMRRLGVHERMDREALHHDGVNLSIDGELFRIDLHALTGKRVTVYGQQEVMRDLFTSAQARGINLVWNAADVALHDVAGDHPHVTWTQDGESKRVDCAFIAGCDGFHGVARKTIPADRIAEFERVYPFGWLGILAEVPPAGEELIYANHARGFALSSMRSPTRSRYYVQVALDEKLEDWPDERIWDELCARMGPEAAALVTRGPSFEKSIAPLRSFVAEPLRYGRLFLAGDSGHIVPPTGAKGLNLAVSDVILLSEALQSAVKSGDMSGLDSYSARALERVWQAEHFSWWTTSITHRFPDMDGFSRRIQQAEIGLIRSSETAQRRFAEGYVGQPMAGWI